MKNKILLFAAAAAILASCAGNGSRTKSVEPEPIPPIGFRASDYTLETTKVKSGETFPALMKRIGLTAEEASVMSSRLDTIFSPRKMKAGAIVETYFSGDSLNRKLEYAVYHHSKTRYTVFKCADSLYLWNYIRPTEKKVVYSDIVIESSLWNDVHKAGAPVDIVGELSDIYAWTVDFFGLQKGDRFQTVYTEVVCEDEVLYVDRVDFCRYTRPSNHDEQIAVRMDVGGTGSDKYFNEKGQNMRKAFLKAPLSFKRISSTFSYARKHPVTGKVRPHTGVDYAAPAGTPVYALGDGVVLSAGWTTTGGGNVIKIRHNSVYTTGYLHLKGFAKGIKAGAKVKQGQVIGYVGSTGTSTGPHLDFRVWQNGSPIDPLKMKSPAADPLPKQYQPQLDSLCTMYMEMIGNGD